MARATWDVRQVSGRSFPNRRYESPDTLETVDQTLPMLGNPVQVDQNLPMLGNPVSDGFDSASSSNTGRSRSPDNYVDAVPTNTPPLPSLQSYSNCQRQSVKRRSQSQGKTGQAAPVSAPRMEHSILATLSQIISCDVKVIIICILVGIIINLTLPQPGTYIWGLAASVVIAYMHYVLVHVHKPQVFKLYQDRRNDSLPTNGLNLYGLGHPGSWDFRDIKQFLRQNSSILGNRLNEILALLGSERFDIRGKELLNPNLVNEEYLTTKMNISDSISRYRLMELINLLREKFNTSTNSKGGIVRNIEAHTVFMDQSQQINHGCNQTFSLPVPVKRAEQITPV